MNAMKFAIPFVLSALFLASLAWILVNSEPVQIPPAMKSSAGQTTASK